MGGRNPADLKVAELKVAELNYGFRNEKSRRRGKRADRVERYFKVYTL